jgi:hypothetical protein
MTSMCMNPALYESCNVSRELQISQRYKISLKRLELSCVQALDDDNFFCV